MQEKSNARVAITGGTSGLGLALVREFLNRGAQVAFVARGRERVERVAQQHPGTHGIAGDVAAKEDIYPIAVQIAGELGGLDVLINNASDLGPAPLALLGDFRQTARQLGRIGRGAGGAGRWRGGGSTASIVATRVLHGVSPMLFACPSLRDQM